MKLRNKKTGEIVDIVSINRDYDGANDIALIKGGQPRGKTVPVYSYQSLAELNSEWEDYEEPKKYWFIDAFGNIVQNEITNHCGDEYTDMTNEYENQKQIGNYFETKEEAEKAAEKLKAWKRLKDKGFRFILDGETEMPMFVYSGANGEKCITNAEESKQCRNDIKLLSGGEE